MSFWNRQPLRKSWIIALFVCAGISISPMTVRGQVCNSTVTSGNEIACGNPQFPCCAVESACNGTATACNSYDPDFSATGGCDLSCTPIDSGVLFLLVGGAAFGGMMIVRRRREALEVIRP